MGFHHDLSFLQGPTDGKRDLGFIPPSCPQPEPSGHTPQSSGYKNASPGLSCWWGNHLQSGLKSPLPQANFGHPESLSPHTRHFKDLSVCLAFLYPPAELCAGHRTIMPRPETSICCRYLVTSRGLFLCLCCSLEIRIMASEASWMCAVKDRKAGKHIPRKVILGDLSGSGIACLDGQQTWRSHWYQKHQKDRMGIIVLSQSFSSMWCLQLRKEDKAEMLLTCKHPSLVLYTQERQKYLLSFPQPSSTSSTMEFLQYRPDGLGSTNSACCGVIPTYPCCSQGIIKQM